MEYFGFPRPKNPVDIWARCFTSSGLPPKMVTCISVLNECRVQIDAAVSILHSTDQSFTEQKTNDVVGLCRKYTRNIERFIRYARKNRNTFRTEPNTPLVFAWTGFWNYNDTESVFSLVQGEWFMVRALHILILFQYFRYIQEKRDGDSTPFIAETIYPLITEAQNALSTLRVPHRYSTMGNLPVLRFEFWEFFVLTASYEYNNAREMLVHKSKDIKTLIRLQLNLYRNRQTGTLLLMEWDAWLQESERRLFRLLVQYVYKESLYFFARMWSHVALLKYKVYPREMTALTRLIVFFYETVIETVGGGEYSAKQLETITDRYKCMQANREAQDRRHHMPESFSVFSEWEPAEEFDAFRADLGL